MHLIRFHDLRQRMLALLALRGYPTSVLKIEPQQIEKRLQMPQAFHL